MFGSSIFLKNARCQAVRPFWNQFLHDDGHLPLVQQTPRKWAMKQRIKNDSQQTQQFDPMLRGHNNCWRNCFPTSDMPVFVIINLLWLSVVRHSLCVASSISFLLLWLVGTDAIMNNMAFCCCFSVFHGCFWCMWTFSPSKVSNHYWCQGASVNLVLILAEVDQVTISTRRMTWCKTFTPTVFERVEAAVW